MKIGEIKIEALKLMFVNYSEDISADDLHRLNTDENYGSYLVNMSGSIQRAIDRIKVVFYPLYENINVELYNSSNVELPEYIARLIPYFVKSELYQEDEPSIANEARNMFEMSLEAIYRNNEPKQTRIVRVNLF